MAFLREIKSEQKDGQHGKEDGVDEIRQALEQALIRPKIKFLLEIAGVAEVDGVVGEEAGVSIFAEGAVDDANRQGQRSLGRVEAEIVKARDGLIACRRVSMRSLGLNRLAVDEDFGAESRRAEAEGGAAHDRQFDEQCKRPVMRSQLKMKPEPCVASRRS